MAALCLAALSLLGLREIESANAQNSAVRIDRAGRAAAALLHSTPTTPDVVVTTDDGGSPIAITVGGLEDLVPGETWDQLLDTIAGVNEGAANLFRFNGETQSFDRISTTFRLPDGSRAGGSTVEPGLISAGHPAFASLAAAERYVGEVPVAGRLRLAYLTPIIGQTNDIAGILAVDVGWVDDLNRINDAAAGRAAAAAALLLGVLAAVGILVMFCSFRPLHHLTEVANSLPTDTVGPPTEPPIELSNRNDEIGHLAKGLSKVAELQRSLHVRAYTDNLTGIANRAALIDELTRRFDQIEQEDGSAPHHDRSFSMLIVDLDGFKEVNDGLGHQVGDEVLIAVARALESEIERGEFLARLGGDEFAVLSRDGSSSRAATTELADRLQSAVAQPFETSGGNARLNASIGMARIPHDATTSSDALRLADLALYEVKRAGGTASRFYDPSLLASFERRLFLTKELRLAMRTGADIRLEYQPLYDTDGRVAAVEALARWTHPSEGVITPGEFIPLAESLGLIADLGATVLDLACRQIADWSSEFDVVPCVSVNVSAMQLADAAFPDQVRQIMRRHSVTPRQLCLEVTESVIVPAAFAPHRRVLAELVAMGLSVAIDDFGTGYSSLNYLGELVVDQVKLDRSFVRAAVDDPKQARLVSGIIGLAKSLELSVVLEGIETERELAFGLANGCDLMQGFHLARPMPAADVAQLFAERLLELSGARDRPVRA